MSYQKEFKFSFYLIIGIVLTLGLSVSMQSILANWVPPTASAPGNNVEPPLNEGTVDQAKLGGLSLGGDLNVDGRMTHGVNNYLYIDSDHGLQLRVNSDGEGTGSFRVYNDDNERVYSISNDGIIYGTEGYSVVNNLDNTSSGITVFDTDNSHEPYSRVNADSFHTNGMGGGQIWIEGYAIDANSDIRLGMGFAGGDSTTVRNVEVGGNVEINGTPTDDNHAVTKEWVLANTGSGKGVTMITQEFDNYSFVNAIDFCRDYSGSAEFSYDGDTTTSYDDWRLPTHEETTNFFGDIIDSTYIWTTTPEIGTSDHYYVTVRLDYGYWYGRSSMGVNEYFRCVR